MVLVPIWPNVCSYTLYLVFFEITRINLIFLEISDIKSIVLIKKLRAKFPNANILVIKNKVEQKLFARAFACGAKDGFQGFYNCDLIVERVAALLK